MDEDGASIQLRLADATRQDDIEGAIAAYREHVDRLRLDDDADRDRLRWIIEEGFAYDPCFDDLVKVAAAQTEDDELRRKAVVVTAQHTARYGNHVEAREILRGALETELGTGSRLELTAVLNLALVSGFMGNDFEALVFARHGAVLAEAHGDVRARVKAILHIASAHVDLAVDAGIEHPLGPVLDLVRREAAGLPPSQARMSLARAALLEAGERLRSGDLAGAKRSAEEWRERLRDHYPPGVEPELRHTYETVTALDEHGPEAALARARLAGEDEEDGLPSDPVLRAVLVRLLLRCGPREQARDLARRTIEACRVDEGRTGIGPALRVAAEVGRALLDHGEEELARTAYAVAISAAASRVDELEACRELLGSLTSISEEDDALLAGYRHAFLARHEGLTAAYGQGGGEYGARLDPHRNETGHLTVCAWCRCVLKEGRAVLPVGHLLPHDPAFGITHGMCAACERRQMRELTSTRT